MNDSEAKSLLCPVCRVDLVMSERQNIEIDYCPKCRGVWLDRGELDKIIDKSMSEASSETVPDRKVAQVSSRPDDRYPAGDRDRYGWSRDGHDSDSHRGGHGGEHGRHGRGFLGRLFD